MDGHFLKPGVDHRLDEQLVEIIHDRANLVAKYSMLIASLDADDPRHWKDVIGAAREGGLTKDVLCETFTCSWSTILRWEAGRNVPGAFARAAIKDKLIELLDQRRIVELDRATTLITSRSPAAA